MSVTASPVCLQFYLYYASSCLPVLGRVVCYGKTIFLTECRVLRDPHGLLFGISFLRISESLPSTKDFHVAFVQTGQIKVQSVKAFHGRGSPPPPPSNHSLTFKVILPFIPTTANLLWTGLQENRISIPDVSIRLTVFYRVQKFPGHTMATHAMRIRASLPRINGRSREAENSPTSNTGVKKALNFTSILANAFVQWCLVTHRNNIASLTLMNIVQEFRVCKSVQLHTFK
jgi:hypothetical protein